MDDPATADLGIDGLDAAEHIGTGGAADVYRAEQTGLGRTVAVKVLRSTTSGKNRDRFERETQTLGRLSSHPGIVTLFQAGLTARGQAFLMMEYCPNGTLADRSAADGPLPWSEACRIVGELAAVVGDAHAAGVLHRDLKPANVLVDGRGNHLIADFGVAALSSTGDFSAATDFTPGYAPPETLRGEPATPAGDVYSLGAMAHALITGRVPFEATDNTNNNVLAWIRRVETEAPADLRPLGVPDDVARLIESAMSKSAAARPDIEGFATALVAAADGIRTAPSSLVPPNPAPGPRPSPEPRTAAVGEILPRPPISTEVPGAVGPIDPPTTEAAAVLPKNPTTLERAGSFRRRGRRRQFAIVAGALLAALAMGGFWISRSSDAPLVAVAGDTTPTTSSSTTATTQTTSTPERATPGSGLTAEAVTRTTEPPPSEAAVTLTGELIVLEGAVPSRSIAKAILEAVELQYLPEQIDDQLEIDSNASSVVLTLDGELSAEQQTELTENLAAIEGVDLEDRIEIVVTAPPTTARPVTTRNRPVTTAPPATAAPTTAAPATTAAPVTNPPSTAPPSSASGTSSMLG